MLGKESLILLILSEKSNKMVGKAYLRVIRKKYFLGMEGNIEGKIRLGNLFVESSMIL